MQTLSITRSVSYGTPARLFVVTFHVGAGDRLVIVQAAGRAESIRFVAGRYQPGSKRLTIEAIKEFLARERLSPMPFHGGPEHEHEWNLRTAADRTAQTIRAKAPAKTVERPKAPADRGHRRARNAAVIFRRRAPHSLAPSRRAYELKRGQLQLPVGDRL